MPRRARLCHQAVSHRCYLSSCHIHQVVSHRQDNVLDLLGAGLRDCLCTACMEKCTLCRRSAKEPPKITNFAAALSFCCFVLRGCTYWPLPGFMKLPQPCLSPGFCIDSSGRKSFARELAADCWFSIVQHISCSDWALQWPLVCHHASHALRFVQISGYKSAYQCAARRDPKFCRLLVSL